VFLVHGASLGFEQIFLPSLSSLAVKPGRSFAVYLARHGLDVWGIDLGWTKVPLETTSFDVMRGWGVEKDARHTGIALAIARAIRGQTHQGFGKLNLLGFSYGVAVAYAYAGLETQRPPALRNVKAIIPVDLGLKYEEESLRIVACKTGEVFQGIIDSGHFHTDQGAQLAGLAMAANEELADDMPGAALHAITGIMACTYIHGGTPPEPFWHFFGGTGCDDQGFAQDLRFTETPFVVDFLSTLPPYAPNQIFADMANVSCDEKDVAFDDHLGEIEVPILYVGAGGGSGAFGDFTTMQTRSSDITSVIVQLLPDDRRSEDFGHGDLFLAHKAMRLAWQPILNWILARSRN
jgi:pimeloyl-ACP methyl ester carboxylesterase